MALTLVEAAKLSNDTLKVGVIETIASESSELLRLPFIPVLGNSLTYNRENASATATFYDVGDTWTEDTPTFTQFTAPLKIIGGDSDVDNFLKRTRSNINDLEAEVLTMKAKAVANLFSNTFINGNTTTNPKSFEGVDRLIVGGQIGSMGINGATLSLAKMDELIDLVKGGLPTALEMSRRTRRQLLALLRATGSGVLETTRDAFGRPVEHYAGIPIAINDWISDTQTQGTSTDATTIYALNMNPVDGLCGIASESVAGDASSLIDVETVGQLETKDATRHRVKMYASLVLFRTTSAAKLVGIRP